MPFVLTREQLYDLVWSTPMQTIAAHARVSNVAVAKRCDKAGIPVPERGYWAKRAAGHAPAKIELPPHDLATNRYVKIGGTLTDELRAMIIGDPGVRSDEDEPVEILTARLRKRLGCVKVPTRFSVLHPVIASLMAKEEARKRKASYFAQFDTPFEQRRLSILNGLFLGFQKIGCSVHARGEGARDLWVSIGGGMTFTLDSVRVRSHSELRRSAKINDRLSLRLGWHMPPPNVVTQWDDRQDLPLEAQLTDIILGISVATAEFYRYLRRLEAEEAARRSEEARREAERRDAEIARKAREQIAAYERARIEALQRGAEDWAAAKNIRNFVAAARETLKGMVPQSDLDKWSHWALDHADELDPLVNGMTATDARACGSNSGVVAERPRDQ